MSDADERLPVKKGGVASMPFFNILIKYQSRRRYLIIYLRSPKRDIADLTSYTVPRASDEYTCESRTG